MTRQRTRQEPTSWESTWQRSEPRPIKSSGRPTNSKRRRAIQDRRRRKRRLQPSHYPDPERGHKDLSSRPVTRSSKSVPASAHRRWVLIIPRSRGALKRETIAVLSEGVSRAKASKLQN